MYTHVRGYHPLLAVAAGTGDVLMARLREGRANTVRGAAHFLRETIGRVRSARCRDRPFCAAKAAEGTSLRTVEWSQRPPRFEMPASRKSEIDGGTYLMA